MENTITSPIQNSPSSPLRKELEADFGNRVKHGGNMQKKEFFDMFAKNVLEPNFIIPIDFNDITSIFYYAQEVDAISMGCEVSEFPECFTDAIEMLKKHHQHTKIRNLVVILGLNHAENHTSESVEPMVKAVHSADDNLIMCITKREDVEPGHVAFYAIAGFYHDVNDDNVRISFSKKLAYLLRHSDMIDAQGFCNAHVAMMHLGITFDELKFVVEHDNKNRYELIGDHPHDGCIRARNGHSGKMKIDPGLTLTTPPEKLYHATKQSALEGIFGKEEGLLPMSRQYVNLTADPAAALEYAKRFNCPVALIEVNALAASLDGTRFYLASNSIWQAEKIPHSHLKLVAPNPLAK